jgi:hypothetical protein
MARVHAEQDFVTVWSGHGVLDGQVGSQASSVRHRPPVAESPIWLGVRLIEGARHAAIVLICQCLPLQSLRSSCSPP